MENQVKVSEWNRQTAAFGMKHIAEAFSARSDQGDEFVRRIKDGMRYFQEFLGNVNPTPNLNEQEAEVARSLHTYLRKGNDEPYGVILYRMIAESRGLGIWYAFTKYLAGDMKRFSYDSAIRHAQQAYYDGHDTTDDIIMLSALKMWEKDWKSAKEWFKE